ncbi:hypothetical protein OQA88_5563 [Cercophora sp. LCS_1]
MTTKTIFFLGATGGCGLSAMRRSLAAGHTCIALCRTPSKLTAILPPSEHPNLIIVEGNAHSSEPVRQGLIHPTAPKAFVDYVISSIGNAVSWEGMRNADADVCRKGMELIISTMNALRKEGYTGRPRILGVSSTGISDFARDLPIAMIPLYKVALAIPHRDKKAMENVLIESGEDWTVVRPSALTNGKGGETTVRDGMEDPIAKKVESKAIGYTISREDTGKWIFEKIIEEGAARKWVKKIATVTY